jgi:Tfp pilus assembly protein PilX
MGKLNPAPRLRQRGVALPVMLIMLAVMMLSSIYLLRSTNSSTMTTSNLAYDSSLAKAADLGLHTAFQFLATQPKSTLVDDSAHNRIQYVIHRMCMLPGAYNSTAPANNCTLAAAKQKVASQTGLGLSLSSDRSEYATMPELHYVITARIYGPRGGNVVTQSVVMMGP